MDGLKERLMSRLGFTELEAEIAVAWTDVGIALYIGLEDKALEFANEAKRLTALLEYDE